MDIPDFQLLLQVLSITAVLALLVFLLGLALLPDTDADTWLTRLYQGTQFRRTRLAKVLKAKNVSVDDYIDSLSIQELKEQRSNCSQCLNFWFCDKQRQAHKLAYGDFSFCPNRNREPLHQILHS